MQRYAPIYACDANQAEVRDDTRASPSRAAELVFTAMDNLLKRADLAIYEARGIRADIPTNNRQLGVSRRLELGHTNPD